MDDKSTNNEAQIIRPCVSDENTGSITNASLSLSPRSLTIAIIPFLEAKELNSKWHSRLPRFGTGFIKNMPFLSFVASLPDETDVAVAIWSNPVARLLPQKSWLELRRLAISDDAPQFTASWMLGKMAKIIRKIRPNIDRLISYQDTEVHTGTIYAAAGWEKTTIKRGHEWSCPSRPRIKSQTTAIKQRWEKLLRAIGGAV